MYDVIIIGRGPAGISASLYTVRANLKTLIIGKFESALRKAGKIENYYGFSSVISGKFLLSEGEKQALGLGVEIVEDEVISLEKDDYFRILTAKGSYECKALLIATGQPHKKPKIENMKDFEGKGISYCSTCDGFFYRNLKVGVLGFKDYAVHEAIELEAFTKDITIYTNGKGLDITGKYIESIKRFKVNTKPVIKLEGSEFLQKIYFDDGSSEEIDGIFVAYESASSVDFAAKLGAIVDGNSIVVDRNMQTNLDGLYAAGDCTGGFKQISTAVGQGALAARNIIEYIRSL